MMNRFNLGFYSYINFDQGIYIEHNIKVLKSQSLEWHKGEWNTKFSFLGELSL